MSKPTIDAIQLPESRLSRISRWAGAAVVAFGLHAGAAAALMHWQTRDDSDDATGALTLDLAPMSAAQLVDSPKVALGPERWLAELAPEASKKVMEKVEKDIPLIEPSPAPEPEAFLPKQQPDKKEQPKEEAKEAVRDKQKPQDEADPITSAPPRIEAQPSQTPASGQGMSASMARAHASWAKAMSAKLERLKRYPPAAERRGVKGVVVVKYRVDRSGQVVSTEVDKSSGSLLLDEEALELLERASPLPAPPVGIADEMLDNFLPIYFGMKPDG
jgi:protein TonB